MSDLCEECGKRVTKDWAYNYPWLHCHHPRKVKREAWVCVYWDLDNTRLFPSVVIHPSEESANAFGKQFGNRFIKAVKVHEWEELSPEK